MAEFYEECYALGDNVNENMVKIENNFNILKSNFAGLGAPANTTVGMTWYDTTNKIMKMRDSADANWLCLLPGDANQKIWVYRNDVIEGMVIDDSVTDKVLAIKGGSNAYNVDGGNPGGTWTQPNHTHTGPNHRHNMNSHTHTGTTGEPDTTLTVQGGTGALTVHHQHKHTVTTGEPSEAKTEFSGTGATGGGATANTYRPAAAVGTLQYPDMS